MTAKLNLLIVFTVVLFFVSCFKEDDRVNPHLPGNTMTDTVSLTNSYQFQVYYDLSDSKAVKSNLRKSWDLGFEIKPDGWRIRLNTSCFMMAAPLSAGQFGFQPDTTGARWMFDNSSGHPDSTALGIWFSLTQEDTLSLNTLFIINRGIDELGNDRGFRQLVIDSLINGTYYFRTAGFDGSNQQAFSVKKNTDKNQAYFSFDTGLMADNEPDIADWDLLFTQYTTLLYTDAGDPYPYLVTGVLLNPSQVEAAVISSQPFEAITFDTASEMEYINQQDLIGYDWKYYDFDSGVYTVEIDRVYLIRDSEGFTYKLRFLGFYNEKGEKGFPSIEFQQL